MDFNSLSFVFNRALSHTFSKKKCLIVFCILVLSGLLVVFFRGLAFNAGHWVKLSLTFLPIFLCTGILLSMGIFLIRIYHDEVKHREVNYLNTLSKSWEVIIGSSYFTIPIILSYLLLWILLGLFVLLSEIPSVGEFFSVILSFAPFLIHLGSLILCILSLAILFIMAPIVALKGLNRGIVFQTMIKRLEYNPFGNIVLGVISLLPLVIISALLTIAANMTGSICLECNTTLQTVLKWFFIMVPFTACLTPAVIFFFNFAAESHVLMQKELSSEKD